MDVYGYLYWSVSFIIALIAARLIFVNWDECRSTKEFERFSAKITIMLLAFMVFLGWPVLLPIYLLYLFFDKIIFFNGCIKSSSNKSNFVKNNDV